MLLVLMLYSILFLLLNVSDRVKILKKRYIVFKGLNSLGFGGTAVWAASVSGNWTELLVMMPGFLLCMAGDIFLAVKNGRHEKLWFLAGLASFLSGHIAFIWAFHYISPIGWKDLIVPAFLVVTAWHLTKLPDMNMQGATVLVLIYAFFVSLLMGKGISIGFASGFQTGPVLLMTGTILFWCSDLLILFLIFYQKKILYGHFINLLTYYYGMFMIAVSILYY